MNEGVVGILRAILTADTTSFEAGMKKAAQAPAAVEKSVTGLTDEVKKLAPQAERMVKSFGGDKLLYQANNLTAAVQKLGGAQKLTEAEQTRVNRTITEAIAKYASLGKTAPQALIDLEKATKKADVATGGFGSSVTGLGKSIAITAAGFFTAQAAWAAAQSAMHGIANEVSSLVMHGAAVDDVAENFSHLTAQANLSGAALLGALRDGTHRTITDFELMKTVNNDLAAGLRLTDQQFKTLATGAFALAQKNGTDVATALETMNDAMLTGRTRALAMLTGTINESAAEDKFAAKLGVTSDLLTEAGKIAAKREAILNAVSAATKRLGEQTDGLDERVAQANVLWTNFHDNLGRTVAKSPVINAAFAAIAEQLQHAFGEQQSDVIKGVAHAIDQLAIGIVGFARMSVSAFGTVLKSMAFVADGIAGLMQFVIDALDKFLQVTQPIDAALAKIDPTGHFKKAAAEHWNFMKTLEASSAQLDKFGKAAEGVWRGNQFDSAFVLMDKSLAGVEQAMVKASAAAMNNAKANAGAATAANGAAGAFGSQGEALVNTTKDYDTFSKKLKELAADLARGMKTLNDEDFLKEFGTRIDEANRQMLQWGITGAKVPASIRAGLERLLRIDLAQWAATNEAAIAGMIPSFEGAAKAAADAANAIETAAGESASRTVDVNRKTGQILQDIQFRRADAQIDAAKRGGAGWKQVADMETHLSRARMEASIANSRTEFNERLADLQRTHTVSQQEYDAMVREQAASEQQMREDWMLTEQAKRAELKITHSIWLRGTSEAIAAVSSGLGQMLTGLTKFKEGWLDIWRSIRQSFANILSQMLNNYLQGFLIRIVSATTGVNFGGAGGGGFGGGGLGSIASSAAGFIPGLFGGGGAAAGTAAGGWALGAGTLTLDGSVAAGAAGAGAAGAGAAGASGAGAAAGAGGGGAAGFLANPAFWTNPWTIAGAAAAALLTWGIAKKGWFRGGEEGVQVNPARDKFLGQFGGLSGLQGRLTQSFISRKQPDAGNKADTLIKALLGSHNMKAFRASEDSIASAFSMAGVRTVKKFNLGGFVQPGQVMPAILHGGSMGEIVAPVEKLAQMRGGHEVHNHYYTIQGWDGADIDRVFRQEIIPRQKRALQLNQDDLRGHTKRVLR